MRYDPFPGPIGIFLENSLSSEIGWEGGGEGGINITIIVTTSTKEKGGKRGNLQARVPCVITTTIKFKLCSRIFLFKSFSE